MRSTILPHRPSALLGVLYFFLAPTLAQPPEYLRACSPTSLSSRSSAYPITRLPDYPASCFPSIGIDSLPVTCFDATTDAKGNIWCAAAGPDSVLRLYRSTHLGRIWEKLLEFPLGAVVRKLEVVSGPTETAFVYVFTLTETDAGDLLLLRWKTGDSAQLLSVATGPDTIDDFSACCDRDSRHYLYCLYANERRGGRNATFTRSRTSGTSWEPGQAWWNCWDPCIVFGGGSTIHCTWRYAGTGREIHFQSSGHYGRLGTWGQVRVVSNQHHKCWDPVIAVADTGKEWHATVWVCYTAAERDTFRQYIGRAVSRDGGITWTIQPGRGNAELDEWAPDLKAFPGSAAGYVYLCYNSGGKGRYDNTTVRFTAANAYLPDRWAKPLALNDLRASSRLEGCTPKVVCPIGAPRQWAAVIYCQEADTLGAGLYFHASWWQDSLPNADEQPAPQAESENRMRIEPNPFRTTANIYLPRPVAELRIYNASGRLVRVLPVSLPSGAIWDGRDNEGRILSSGIYLVTAPGVSVARLLRLEDR